MSAAAQPRPGIHPSWHALAGEEVARRLGTDAERGLSAEQARRRLFDFGSNALEVGGRRRWYGVLARQFTDILIVILFAAAGISLVIGERIDAAAILVIIFLNGILGFVQEWQAERALEALRQMLAPQCHVVRDDQERRIDAADLVPGDLVVLSTGDRVPADLRLVEIMELKVDESSLTGESESVGKQCASVPEEAALAERTSMAWMGTAVTSGRGRGVVAATGMDTEFGRIARLTESVDTKETPLQQKLGTLGKQLGIAGLSVSMAVGLVGWFMGNPPFEMLLTGISLAVAVVPEGLPAVVTITLALGVRAMARRRALLRRLQAAESLGAASVICTDKTGTLTQNEMTVTRVWVPSGWVDVTGVGYDPAGHFEAEGRRLDPRARPDLAALLTTGLLCANARVEQEKGEWHRLGEPTEAALVVAAHKAWLDRPSKREAVMELPFSSARKRMSVVYPGAGGRHIVYAKGAPEVILERCTQIAAGAGVRALDEKAREEVERAYEEMARKGLRTLALARRNVPDARGCSEEEIERDLTLLGVVGIIDPPRPEVPDALRLAKSAGIAVVMITGDAAPTALAVADRIGLRAARAVTGPQLEKMDDEELRKALLEGAVFARTTPEHKLRIVEVLQAEGHVVGMTGDGVNDAPALKKAQIGIAMGRRGTDVAKGAADMVLTDDNFASIIGAVEEGRRQYDNIQKFVRYLLTSNCGELLLIFINVVLGGPLALLPVHILWVNLITDGLSAVTLGLEPVEEGVMKQPPRPLHEPILTRGAVATLLAIGAYVGAVALGIFRYYEVVGSLASARTAAFTALVVLELVNVFNFRALRVPMSRVGFFTNPWMLLAVGGMFALQLAVVYVPALRHLLSTEPLRLADWGLIAAVSIPLFLIVETVKWAGLRRRSRASALPA